MDAGRNLRIAAATAVLALAQSGSGCRDAAAAKTGPRSGPEKAGTRTVRKIEKTEAEWRKILTPEQYHVLREQGTEYAFTGACWNLKQAGIYRCAGCKSALFGSGEKFDSGTGWPSYTGPVTEDAVETHADRSHGMKRTEVLCAACGGHLGHVFEDGPPPTGLRYCINSAALIFEPAKAEGKPAK
jgi:peptide-methionine (R)-S-oxide reductase